MTAYVGINWAVGAMMLLSAAGGALRIAVRYPDTAPDFTEANEYLAAKAAAAEAAAVAGRVPAPRAPAATETAPAPVHQHAA